MSQDKIGTVIRSLVATPKQYLGVVLDIANKLGGDDGAAWYDTFKAQLKAGTAEVVRPQLPGSASVSGVQQTALQRIYDKHFADLNVIVPAFADQVGKVAIYVDGRLTCDMIFAAWTFNKWKWMDGSIDAKLDMTREARSGIGSYLVRVENGVEPDQKFLGKSTRTVDADGTIGITLKERMLLELFCFEQTGKPLDVRGVTFCSGSRYLDGFVPCAVLGGDGYVNVGGYGIGNSDGGSGVREAVLETL